MDNEHNSLVSVPLFLVEGGAELFVCLLALFPDAHSGLSFSVRLLALPFADADVALCIYRGHAVLFS